MLYLHKGRNRLSWCGYVEPPLSDKGRKKYEYKYVKFIHNLDISENQCQTKNIL